MYILLAKKVFEIIVFNINTIEIEFYVFFSGNRLIWID